MEVRLQELLETIKKDGVESAEKEAVAIVAKARAEAQAIIAAAEKKTEDLKETARQDQSRFESSAKAAVSQAGRDMLISIQKALQTSFDRIVQKTIAESFSGAAFTDSIVSIVKSFQAHGELEVPPETLKTIEAGLRAKLGTEIKAGLELKGNNLLTGGFILREKGGGAYYDFSDQSIAEVIKAALNEQIADLISIK